MPICQQEYKAKDKIVFHGRVRIQAIAAIGLAVWFVVMAHTGPAVIKEIDMKLIDIQEPNVETLTVVGIPITANGWLVIQYTDGEYLYERSEKDGKIIWLKLAEEDENG